MTLRHSSQGLAAEIVVAPLLSDSERLLWSGRPRQGIVVRPIDVLLIPCSVIACVFLFAWSYLALKYFPIPLKLTAVLAIGFAFYLTCGRFLLDARRRGRLVYAITDQRCLWIREPEHVVVKEIVHPSYGDVGLTTFGGKGTISFGRPNGLAYSYGRAMGFDQIKDATAESEMIEGAESVLFTLRAVAVSNAG